MSKRFLRVGFAFAAMTAGAVALVTAQSSQATQAAQAVPGTPAARGGQTVARVSRVAGYLSAAEMPDVKQIVPPAPKTGDPRFTNDMAIFRATRALEGTSRWAMALADDELSTAALLRNYSCALGVTATAENAPRLYSFLSRTWADANRASNTLKEFYQHKRPFQVADGAVCVTPAGRARLEQNADYPSGHTAISWAVGLALSELAPDAAAGLLARARAYGQSRVVCGVHNASAVEAGWMTATAVFAAQHGSAEFRADAEASRAELAALRKSGSVDAAACATQTELATKAPF
jgi:acid phosphatase (class A)